MTTRLFDQSTAMEKWIAIAALGAATVSFSVGYLLPSTGTSLLKDVLIWFSGAGISFVLARTTYREAESQRVQSLCNRTVQRLALVVSDLREIAERLKSEVSPSDRDLLISMIVSHSREVDVTIGDLEEMAGKKISLDELVNEVRASLRSVADALPIDAAARAQVVDALEEPLKSLEEQAKDVGLLTALMPEPPKHPVSGPADGERLGEVGGEDREIRLPEEEEGRR